MKNYRKRYYKLKTKILLIGIGIFVCFTFYETKGLAAIKNQKYNYYNLSKWSFEGDVSKNGKELCLGSPNGKISTLVKITVKNYEFIIMQVQLKLNNIKLGERTFQAPTLLLKSNTRQNANWIRNKNNKWRVETILIRKTKETDRCEIIIRNKAIEGDILIRKVNIWYAKKEDLKGFDFKYDFKKKSKMINKKVKARQSTLKYTLLNKKLFCFNSKYYFKEMDKIKILNNENVNSVEPFIAIFPGGTIANYYNWVCDCLRPNDLHLFPDYKNSPWHQTLFDQLSRKNSLGLDEVMDWTSSKKIGVALVLNTTIAPNSMKLDNFIKHIRKKNDRIEIIEFGNEVYYDAQRGKNLSNRKEYIAVLRKLAKDIKNRNHGLTVGLPFSTENWEWNKSIAQAGIKYDAIILHFYARTSSIASKEDDLFILDYPHTYIPNVIKRLKKMAPQKTFWITEWGVLDRPLFRRNNSHIGTLFSANMLISMMRQPDIKAACFHALFDPNFGLFRFLMDATPEKFDNEINLSKQYSFWKRMREIFTNYDETAQMKLTLQDGRPTGQEIQIQSFRKKERHALIIINNSPVLHKISFGGVNIKSYTKKSIFVHPDSPHTFKSILDPIPPLSIVILES